MISRGNHALVHYPGFAGRTVLACMAMLAVSCSQVPDAVEEEQKAHRAVGQRMALVVGHLLNRQGRIVVITADPKLTPTGEMQLKPFMKAVAKMKGLTVVATETLGAPARAPGQPAPLPGRGLPAAELERLLAQHAQVDALVSFVGPPLLTPEQLRRYAAAGQRPQLAVTLVGFDREDIGPALKQQFQANLIHLALLPRATPEPQQKRLSPFDRYYQIITAQNAALLPN